VNTRVDGSESDHSPKTNDRRPISPLVSVIVYYRDHQPFIENTLHSLQRQTLFEQIEILFPDGSPDGAGTDLARAFPWLHRMALPGSTMPELKGKAIETAAGEYVAILDPGSIAPPDWIEKILDGFRDEQTMAIGGAVSFDSADTVANRAAYLFEYCAFNPPVLAGPTAGDLAGNSVAYRHRCIVVDCADLLRTEGFYKPFFHDRLRTLGGEIVLLPDLIVGQSTDYRYFPFAMRRGHFGRCYAARRLKHCSVTKKWVLRIFAPLAAPMVIVRNLPKVKRHPKNLRMFSKTWLSLLGICVFWGVGEWIGYWFGAGKSCRRLY